MLRAYSEGIGRSRGWDQMVADLTILSIVFISSSCCVDHRTYGCWLCYWYPDRWCTKFWSIVVYVFEGYLDLVVEVKVKLALKTKLSFYKISVHWQNSRHRLLLPKQTCQHYLVFLNLFFFFLSLRGHFG